MTQVNCTTIRSIYGKDEVFYDPEHTMLQKWFTKCKNNSETLKVDLKSIIDKCCPPDAANFEQMILMFSTLSLEFGMDEQTHRLFGVICGLPNSDKEFGKLFSLDARFAYYKSQLPELQLLARELISAKMRIVLLGQLGKSN